MLTVCRLCDKIPGRHDLEEEGLLPAHCFRGLQPVIWEGLQAETTQSLLVEACAGLLLDWPGTRRLRPELEMVVTFKSSTQWPTSRRLHRLPEQYHQLGSLYSNTWTCGEKFTKPDQQVIKLLHMKGRNKILGQSDIESGLIGVRV